MITKLFLIPAYTVVFVALLGTLSIVGQGAEAILKGLAFALMLWQ